MRFKQLRHGLAYEVALGPSLHHSLPPVPFQALTSPFLNPAYLFAIQQNLQMLLAVCSVMHLFSPSLRKGLTFSSKCAFPHSCNYLIFSFIVGHPY